MRLVYATMPLPNCSPISQALEKRSIVGNGNSGLTRAEIGGLVVGIVGVFLTALTVLYKGWECWKLRIVSCNLHSFK
jgi:hypothetical protein